MKKLDLELINDCLIYRKVELREHINFYKIHCDKFELDLDTYKDKISAYENEIARIEEELNKIREIRFNLLYQN